jgi:hypothetical protein
MYNLGDLAWVKNTTNSSSKEGWGLMVDTKSTGIIGTCAHNAAAVVFTHDSRKQISPDAKISFKILNRHLAWRSHG